MSTIHCHNLTKTYRTYVKSPGFAGAVRGLFDRKYESTDAAQNVSFDIEEGELVGFLGPNGAGKTTTLKMLAGLLHPTSGEATVLGYVPWERHNAYKRQFALVLGQKNQLWWDLPASESLELNRVIYGIDSTQATRTITELAELLDVRDKLPVMVRELSLGERMKMELIAALLHQPKVLFLDEPTIGLDVISQQTVRDFLKVYTREKRITTMLTSHYMQDIEELCERVIIIDHGKLFHDGSLQGIVDRFSTHKLITLSKRIAFPEFNYNGLAEVLEQDPRRVKLKVARADISQATAKLLSSLQPDDITIEEVPIEDIIRDLFSEKR